jgi:nucleoside-diphosphate-sugar epimerase
MRVLLTGATGYIGSAVAEALREAGHEVIGLARSESKADWLKAAGYRAAFGNLRDPHSLLNAAGDAEAIIHAGMDLTSQDAGAVDRQATETLLSAGKPFVYTSGIWVIGPTFGRTVGEMTPLSPPALVTWRPAVENTVLDGGGVVLRPGTVHGRKGGRVAGYMKSAREEGVVRFVGNGENHWTWVHIDDVARAYVLALEKRPAGEMFLIVNGQPVKIKALGAAIVKAVPGTRIEYMPVDDARGKMGAVAEALALDQKVASTKALRSLGWWPKAPGVLEEIESGQY